MWNAATTSACAANILNAGRGMSSARLFRIEEYPRDMMVLYAQGYSVTAFLVESSDRQTFLDFLGQVAKASWGWRMSRRKRIIVIVGVDEMEQAWLDSLRGRERRVLARNIEPHSR